MGNFSRDVQQTLAIMLFMLVAAGVYFGAERYVTNTLPGHLILALAAILVGFVAAFFLSIVLDNERGKG